MSYFSWLHLTDLHCGMREYEWFWPRMEERFLEDLRVLHDLCGPWDLVFFTGDLTQQGSPEEFRKVSQLLKEMWKCLERLGSCPLLLVVPGNHDLVRPSPYETSLSRLIAWSSAREVQEEFWNNAESPYRRLVGKAFENYMEWWNREDLRVKKIMYYPQSG